MDIDVLAKGARHRLKDIGQADLLVAIPTHNNAATIETVVKAVVGGLAESFPRARAVILNCDGGSDDGTPTAVDRVVEGLYHTVFVEHIVPRVHSFGAPVDGLLGYENAVRAAFQVGDALRVKACVVVDGNLRSVTPDWIRLLFGPLLDDGVDFVAPLFRRHKFDGSLTNSVLYPLTRALYGKRLRFQGAGGVGFSAKLASCYVDKEVWGSESSQFGIENWLATVAVAEGYEVCQASLGPKVPDAKTPAMELSLLLAQAVRSVFELMEEYRTVWESRHGSSPVSTVGPPCELGTDPVNVNPQRMANAFRQGLRDLLPIWELILADETAANILPLGIQEEEEFRFPVDLWVQVVYDFALAYHERVVHREHLLKALTPLYLGRTASFVMEYRESSPEQVELGIEEVCRAFETHKPYLVERWRYVP